jgi:phage shock protein A
MSQVTIFGRVSQLVRANLNDMIDRAEDPEKMLDQLVRDFSNAIDEATQEVATSIGNLRNEEQDLESAKGSIDQWGNSAKAASHKADDERAAGNTAEADRLDALAKIAIQKQISFETQVTTLTAKVAADTTVVDGLKDGLLKMQAKLDTLKDKRQELISRAKMVQAQQTVQKAVGSINAADPTSDIARFEDRIRSQEAQVKGMAELDSESLDSQFAALDADAASTEADSRLAAMKQKAAV